MKRAERKALMRVAKNAGKSRHEREAALEELLVAARNGLVVVAKQVQIRAREIEILARVLQELREQDKGG